jgi:hypothetical protein
MALCWEDGLVSRCDIKEEVDGMIPRLEPQGELACSHSTIRISFQRE